MPTSVSNKVNTQKQFRKMPERVYQKDLNTPHFGSDYTDRADLEGEQFAKSLGVLGENIWREKVHHETREMNQWTLDKAKAMIAGKTTQDLANLDNIMTLQQASSSFDLTDNRYAMALLDRAVGEQMADNAMQDYLKENEGRVPGSVQEAVEAYSSKVQDAFAQGKGRVMNEEAFRDGLYSNMYVGVNTISDNARKLIKADKQNTGRTTMATRFQKLWSHSNDFSSNKFAVKMGELCREYPLYFDNASQAREGFAAILTDAVQNGIFKDMTSLKTIEQMEFFPGHKVGDEIPLGFAYKAVGKQTNKDLVAEIRKKYTDKNGRVNETAVLKELKSIGAHRREIAFDTKIIPSTGNTEWDTQIKKMGAQYEIPPGIIHFLLEKESSFDASARNKDSGAIGLAQFLPETAADMEIDPSDPMQAIEGCAKYLNWLVHHDNNNGETMDDKLQWAIKHYNCGPGNSPENAEELANNAETIEYFNYIWGNYSALKDNPDAPKSLLAPVAVKYNGYDNGEVPEWATSLHKPLYNALPLIMGKLTAMGYTDACITSGTREANEAGNSGDNSDHVDHGEGGDAIDIWIGDNLSEDELQEVANEFGDYFSQVLGEDPNGVRGNKTGATGKHIHLGGYLGGLEATSFNNELDYNAQAFNGNQLEALLAENKRQDAIYDNEIRERKAQQLSDYNAWKYNNGNPRSAEEVKAYIDNMTAFSEGERAKFKIKIDKAEIARAKRAAKAPYYFGDDAIWEKYGKNQYAKDIHEIDLLRAEKLQNPDLFQEGSTKQNRLDWLSERTAQYESTSVCQGTDTPKPIVGKWCYWLNGQRVPFDNNHRTITALTVTKANHPEESNEHMQDLYAQYLDNHPDMRGLDNWQVDENPDVLDMNTDDTDSESDDI